MVEQDMPHQSFNLIALIFSFLAFVWGWGAFRRFCAMLNYRYAALTENTVMLRGLGGQLSQFSGTMPNHARSILHTRNAAAAKDVKFMYVPFHVHPFRTIDPNSSCYEGDGHFSNESILREDSKVDDHDRISIPVISTAKENVGKKSVSFAPDPEGPVHYGQLNDVFTPHPKNQHEIVPKSGSSVCGYVTVWCATECSVFVLYGLNMNNLKRFFKYSIKANKLFMKGTKYRDKADDLRKRQKSKNASLDRGSTDRHIYAERLKALFTKKSLCTAFVPVEGKESTKSQSAGIEVNVPVYDPCVQASTSGLTPYKRDRSISTSHEEIDLSASGDDIITRSGYSKISDESFIRNGETHSPNNMHERNIHLYEFLRGHALSQYETNSTSADANGSNVNSRINRPTENSDRDLPTSEEHATREPIGILIIPRDLPCTGTPQYVAPASNPLGTVDTSKNASPKLNADDTDGDIELGSRSTHLKSHQPDNVGCRVERTRFTSLDFGLQVLEPSDNVSALYDVDELFVHASGSMYVSSDIYGLSSDKDSKESEHALVESEDSNECVICLTEAQEIFLLPCRHLCVCRDCFPHIDKCPVCRSQFNDYITIHTDRLISLKAPKCVNRKGQGEANLPGKLGSHDEDKMGNGKQKHF